MMRAALYARVSTHEQHHELQLRELREFCERRAWSIAGEFVDVGISGRRESRPQLDALLARCRRRQVDVVLVYRYDRFARSLRQLVNALDEFDALGIQFVSLHEGVDTTTAAGRFVFGIFGSLAEFERELIVARVKSGIAAAKARGTHVGRPRFLVDAGEIERLRRLGTPWRAIGRRLGIPTATAQRALNRLLALRTKTPATGPPLNDRPAGAGAGLES